MEAVPSGMQSGLNCLCRQARPNPLADGDRTGCRNQDCLSMALAGDALGKRALAQITGWIQSWVAYAAIVWLRAISVRSMAQSNR